MIDVQWTLRTAVVLPALTALGGLLMAGIRFAGKPHPPHQTKTCQAMQIAKSRRLPNPASQSFGKSRQ